MQEQPERKIYLQEYKAISRAISTYEDLNLLLNHITEGICWNFKVKGCSIMLYDEREKQLFHVSSHGISEEYLNKGPVFVDGKHSSFVTGEPVFVENFQDDPRVQYPDAATKEGFRSMLSVPIMSRKEPIGVIRIYNSEPWALHDEDLDSFRTLAEHLGLVIENHGLRNFLDGVKMAMQSLPLRMLEDI